MESISTLVLPIDHEKQLELDNIAQNFVRKWNEIPTLADIASPTGKGVTDDIFAIDYVIYEQLENHFFADLKSMILCGSVLLGNFLVQSAKMQWNYHSIYSSKALCLTHPDCSITVPIQEMVVNKYSGLPQFDTFETLFFDILFSSIDLQNTHPLNEAGLIPLTGEKTYFEKYGFEIPKRILYLFTLYGLPDEGQLIRHLGLEAYAECKQQDWKSLEKNIKSLDYSYKELYGKDWQEWFQKSNKDLFRNISNAEDDT